MIYGDHTRVNRFSWLPRSKYRHDEYGIAVAAPGRPARSAPLTPPLLLLGGGDRRRPGRDLVPARRVTLSPTALRRERFAVPLARRSRSGRGRLRPGELTGQKLAGLGRHAVAPALDQTAHGALPQPRGTPIAQQGGRTRKGLRQGDHR